MSSWTAVVWGCLGIGPVIQSWRLMTYTYTQNHRDLLCFVVLSHPKRLATDEQFRWCWHILTIESSETSSQVPRSWRRGQCVAPRVADFGPASNDILMWKWHEMTWNDLKWHEMTWNDMKWHDMTWNDMKWQPWPSSSLGNSSKWGMMMVDVPWGYVWKYGIWWYMNIILFIEWGRWWPKDQSANFGLPDSQRNTWRNPCFGPGLSWVFRCEAGGAGRNFTQTSAIRLSGYCSCAPGSYPPQNRKVGRIWTWSGASVRSGEEFQLHLDIEKHR